MELGNMMFGNSRGEYEFPNRELVDCKEWQELLDRCDLDIYGCPKIQRDYYGFDNDIFQINPYYWGECDCGANDNEEEHKENCSLLRHNFIYKPTGFWIDWYKYSFRDSYMSEDLSEIEIKKIWGECTQSIKLT